MTSIRQVLFAHLLEDPRTVRIMVWYIGVCSSRYNIGMYLLPLERNERQQKEDAR